MLQKLVLAFVSLSLAAAVGVVAPFGGEAGAQPGNDDFANALAVTGALPYTNSQSTVGATREAGEPGIDTGPPCDTDATVWYKYTPSGSATLTFDTFGSDFWTYVAVYRGPSSASFSNLALVACELGEDFDGAALTFSGTSGSTYYFQVGGLGGDSGDLLFNLRVRPGLQAAGTIALPPGADPTAMEFYAGGNKLFIYDDSTASLLMFDAATGQMLPGSIPVPGDWAPVNQDGLVVSEARGRVFAAKSVGATSEAEIVVADAVSGSVDGGPVSMGCGSDVRLALNDVEGQLWFTCFESIGVMDIATRAVTLINTGDRHIFGDLKVNEAAGEVYVAEYENRRLAIVNGDTQGLTFVPIDGSDAGPSLLGVNPAEHKVYVKRIRRIFEPAGLCVIDLDDAPPGCTALGAEEDYGEMAFNPLSNRIFTSVHNDEFAAIIEGATDALTNVTAPMGSGATVVRDSTDHAYVFSSDEIGVLDGNSKTELLQAALMVCEGGSIFTDSAVDQATGRVYSLHSGHTCPEPILHVMQDGAAGPPRVQGNVNCDDAVDSVDALQELRFVAHLGVSQQPGCPEIGSEVASLFGDVDCDDAVDSVDALLVLRFVAQLPVNQNEPCPDIGTALT